MIQAWLTYDQIVIFVGEQPIYFALFFLMVLDVITGIGAAFGTKTLSSDISWYGMMRKAMMWAVIILAMIIGWVTNFGNILAFGTTLTLGSITAIGFMVSEALSILENTGRLGVLPPVLLKDALDKLNETSVVVKTPASSKVEAIIEPIEDSKPGGARRNDPKK